MADQAYKEAVGINYTYVKVQQGKKSRQARRVRNLKDKRRGGYGPLGRGYESCELIDEVLAELQQEQSNGQAT